MFVSQNNYIPTIDKYDATVNTNAVKVIHIIGNGEPPVTEGPHNITVYLSVGAFNQTSGDSVSITLSLYYIPYSPTMITAVVIFVLIIVLIGLLTCIIISIVVALKCYKKKRDRDDIRKAKAKHKADEEYLEMYEEEI